MVGCQAAQCEPVPQLKRAPDFLLRSLPARADTSHPIAGPKVDVSKMARPARAVQTRSTKGKAMLQRRLPDDVKACSTGLPQSQSRLAGTPQVKPGRAWPFRAALRVLETVHTRATLHEARHRCFVQFCYLNPPARAGPCGGALCHVFNSPPSGAGDTGTTGQSVCCD